jgi:glycosyltransferase involved in cell wall biosynthesis
MWRAAREVARIAAKFDVIHANSQKALFVGSVAAVAARKPLVWHLHDIIERPWFSRMNIAADVLFANRCASRVIAVSHATADAFVRQGGNPASVNVVHNGIDTTQFDGVAPASREALGLPARNVIGCFSRLAEWKGQHVLIEATSQLPDAHVLLVGGPLFGEHAYERKLHELVTTLGMTDRVHFLGQRNDVAPLMQIADLIVHPSTAPEPFARTLIEAMLCGRPPIASACGGVPELIESGRTGYLFTPGDVVGLRALLRQLLDAPEHVARTVDAAREHARRNFSMPTFVAAVEAQLSATVASHRPRFPFLRARQVNA